MAHRRTTSYGRRIPAPCHLRPALAAAAVLAVLLTGPPAHAASPGLVISGFDIPRVQQAISTGAEEIAMFVPWQSMQPNNPNQAIDKAYMDALTAAVREINQANRRVLLIFNGTPPWANGGQTDPDYAPVPEHVGDYASFIARVVRDLHDAGLHVDRIQPWNEPDDPNYWKPWPEDIDRYVSMLVATYDAVKNPATGDPSVQVFAASTAGNHADWIDQLLTKSNYKLDGVAVDSASSCGTDGPDKLYRDPDGRIGRFAFMGFLEVLEVLDKHGRPNMPLIFAVMGISSTNGGPTSCARGSFAGQKPSGVSDAEQARLLKAEYQCLANYPRVTGADWYRLEDTVGDPDSAEFDHYGLYYANADGTLSTRPKPSLAAFKEIVAGGGGPAAFCADLIAPAINVISPTPNQQFDDRIDIRATASDDNVGLGRISFFVDSAGDSIRNYTEALANGAEVGLTPWFGSRELALGKHTVRVMAVDRNGNQAAVEVPVEKVPAGTLATTLLPRLALPKRVLARNCTTRPRRGATRRCSADFGMLAKPADRAATAPSIPGKVRFEWEWRNAKRKWRKLIGGLVPAAKPLKVTVKIPKRGKWRVRVVYPGGGVYKPVTSKWVAFTAK